MKTLKMPIMKIREAAIGEAIYGVGTYNVQYLDEFGRKMFVQLNANSLDELEELYQDYCLENDLSDISVLSVDRV
ncbi:hypothetical protein LJC51_07480 [Lachnospiraceae bacterium OttesenSCG-928-J05]|nr:hypothetical protein [Lachnospiraceae bacterium OttesenSCG-928-J05]